MGIDCRREFGREEGRITRRHSSNPGLHDGRFALGRGEMPMADAMTLSLADLDSQLRQIAGERFRSAPTFCGELPQQDGVKASRR